jgi:hypothetical protein
MGNASGLAGKLACSTLSFFVRMMRGTSRVTGFEDHQFWMRRERNPRD